MLIIWPILCLSSWLTASEDRGKVHNAISKPSVFTFERQKSMMTRRPSMQSSSRLEKLRVDLEVTIITGLSTDIVLELLNSREKPFLAMQNHTISKSIVETIGHLASYTKNRIIGLSGELYEATGMVQQIPSDNVSLFAPLQKDDPLAVKIQQIHALQQLYKILIVDMEHKMVALALRLCMDELQREVNIKE